MTFRSQPFVKTWFLVLLVLTGSFLIFDEVSSTPVDGNPCSIVNFTNTGDTSQTERCNNDPISSPEFAASITGSWTVAGSADSGQGQIAACILDPTGADSWCNIYSYANAGLGSGTIAVACGEGFGDGNIHMGCTTAHLTAQILRTVDFDGQQTLNIGCKDPSASNYTQSGSCVYPPPPSPPTCDIRANGSNGPISVPYNSTVSITWSSTNATSGNIDGVSVNPVSGSSGDILTQSRTYTFNCSGPGGSGSDQVTVNVGPAVTLTASPTSVNSGGSSTLSWTSVNATSCTASGGWSGSKAVPNGSQSTGALSTTTTYTLTCTNSTGLSASQSATVTVTQPSQVNLDFFVKDTCGNPISGASVSINQDFGNGTNRTTDGAGFANFGVNKNTVIGWSVSASGYSPSSGSVNSGNNGATVNVTLSGPCGSPPPPPPGAPTADIKANGSNGPISITSGTSATISWTSTNATSCSVAPTGWTGVSNSGISTGNLTSNRTYTLSCIGSGGDTSDSVTVNVSGGPPTFPPTTFLDIPISGATVTGGVGIGGWAIDNANQVEGAISRVDILIDGVLVNNNSYGNTNRSDVCVAFPGRVGCPNVGYSYVWDSTSAANGNHTIRVVAVDSTGQTDSIDRIVTVSNAVAGACNNGVDIGLRLYQDGVRKIAVEPGSPTSPLRIYKDGIRGVVLVDPSDPNASKMLIKTPSGVKALCVIP